MAIKRILKYPDPFLRKKTDVVDCSPLFSSSTGEKIRDAEIINPELYKHLEDMEDTLEECDKKGAALAANQIGIPLRMFVTNQSMKSCPVPPFVINPVILEKSQETEMLDEGCLSFPGFFMKVRRHKQIKVTYVTLTKVDGKYEAKQMEETYDGFWAQVFQHECDHLDGKLFVDALPIHKRMKIIEILKKNR